MALLNPSPMSLCAHPQLIETLRVLNAFVVDEACVTLPISGRGLDAAAIVADPELGAQLRRALDVLRRAIQAVSATDKL